MLNTVTKFNKALGECVRNKEEKRNEKRIENSVTNKLNIGNGSCCGFHCGNRQGKGIYDCK